MWQSHGLPNLMWQSHGLPKLMWQSHGLPQLMWQSHGLCQLTWCDLEGLWRSHVHFLSGKSTKQLLQASQIIPNVSLQGREGKMGRLWWTNQVSPGTSQVKHFSSVQTLLFTAAIPCRFVTLNHTPSITVVVRVLCQWLPVKGVGGLSFFLGEKWPTHADQGLLHLCTTPASGASYLAFKPTPFPMSHLFC